MVASNISDCVEGNSTTGPPLFNRSNYKYLNVRMIIYLQFINYYLWKVIRGPYVPNRTIDGNTIEKP